MTKKQIAKYLFFKTLGNFLILFMVFGFLATFGPALYYEITYRIGNLRGVSYVLSNKNADQIKAVNANKKESVPESLFGSVLSEKKVQELIPVDPSIEAEYLESLKHSVAHAKGTALPGLGGTTYLFAHSADNFWDVGRYNAVFYLLKDLELGDEVNLFFQDKRHTYTVYDKKIVDPSEVDFIAANLGKGEKVILQTCWPPGTAWKRLLIFAKPKNS
jgi:sortase A